MSRSLFALLFLAPACHVRPESLLPDGTLAHSVRTSDFLDGRARSFVVLGDGDSFVWPAMLADMLDEHGHVNGLYRVLNAAVPGGSIGAWDPSAPEHAFHELAVDYLSPHGQRLESAQPPRVALCLVTLRGLSDAGGPVKSENDMLGAEMGADALERLARALHERGVEQVVFGTTLYTANEGPEPGLEHVAIERLLTRGLDFVQAGPDFHAVSRRFYPDAYSSDGIHPNEFGLKLLAEEWYRWLAGPEAREEVVEGVYAKDYDVDALEAAHAREVAAPQP